MADRIMADSYQTPATTKRAFGDYLFCGSSIWGLVGIFISVMRCAYRTKFEKIRPEIYSDAAFSMMDKIEKCQGSVSIEGMDNISKVKGPVVFIGNHMSMLETMFLPAMIVPRRNATYVIKKSLTELPIFGGIMRGMNCIAVGRENPKMDFKTVIQEGKNRLQSDCSVIIFPQSTRSSSFDTSMFNTLGVKLAKAAKVPIIPLALKTDFLGNGKYFKSIGKFFRKEKIHFAFGEPIEVAGSGKEEHETVVKFITEKVTAWGVTVK